MKLTNGILKIVHGFNYAPDASFEKKCAVMRETLTDLKEKGYDGIVTNVDIAVAYADAAANPGTENGYLRSEESWNVLVKRMDICRELGLRVWIYDEEGYPSGAAGTLTLDARPDLEALARDISEQKAFPVPQIKSWEYLSARLILKPFYRWFMTAKKFRVEENCIGCGKCERVCPLGNIRMEKGLPRWGENCTHCMACINFCPKDAIQYGSGSIGKVRYRGPEQTLKEDLWDRSK